MGYPYDSGNLRVFVWIKVIRHDKTTIELGQMPDLQTSSLMIACRLVINRLPCHDICTVMYVVCCCFLFQPSIERIRFLSLAPMTWKYLNLHSERLLRAGFVDFYEAFDGLWDVHQVF